MRSARFWAVFLAIAIIGTITWLAIFEHNYHPRIYRYNEEVTIPQVGESELARLVERAVVADDQRLELVDSQAVRQFANCGNALIEQRCFMEARL